MKTLKSRLLFLRAVTHVADTPAALGGVTQVCTKAEKYLLTCLSKLELRDAFAVPKLGGFLLCGPHGSGKTVVARSIIHKLSQNRETLARKGTIFISFSVNAFLML